MKFPFIARRRLERLLREIAELKSTVLALQQSRTRLLGDLEVTHRARHDGPPLPVIIGIDVEFDARVVDLADPSWRGAALFFSRMGVLRKQISFVSGGAPLRLSWFPRIDPQVEKANGSTTWALQHFATEWEVARREGDEIGLHMHPWRWEETAAGWVQDFGDDAWVLDCARSSIHGYRKVFGETPAAFRAGDRFMSDALVSVLRAEGVKIDLSLERMPGTDRLAKAERGTGAIPDTSKINLNAYRPSTMDFRIPDPEAKSGLVMLPLTAGKDGTLTPWLPNAEFEEALDLLLATGNGRQLPTHLAFVARSDLAENALWDNYVDNLLSLARRVRKGLLVFATPSEALDMIIQPEPDAAI
jgi:hypothetical protein